MRARGPIVLGLAAVGLVGVALAAWPAIEDAAARAIERRLHQETGEVWRIRGGASLGLMPPQIVIRDLALDRAKGGPGGLGLQVRRATLSDPLSLAFGTGRSGHAVAEGVRLDAGLDAASPQAAAASESRPLDTIAKIDATLRGARIDADPRAKTVTATADVLDIAFETADRPETTAIKVGFELGADRLGATLDLKRAEAGQPRSGPLHVTYEPRAGGHRVEARGKAVLLPAALQLDDLAGAIDREPFSGSARLDFAAEPRLALDLALEALTLTNETPDPAAAAGAVVVKVPPDLIPQVSWFDGYTAKASFRFGRLTLGRFRFETVKVTADVKNRSLDLAIAEASAYEGGARGRYVLAPEADGTGRHQLGLSLAKARVRPLLVELAGVRGLDGSATLRVDLQAKGALVEEVRQSAKGAAEVSIADGTLDGLDLASAFLPGLSGGGRTGSFATRLELLSGRFAIAEGHALTEDLQLKTALLQATGIGSVDLIGQTLDIRFKPQLVTQRQPGARRPPDVPVRVHGPWTSPSVSADFSAVAKDPGSAIQTLQDFGEDLLGKDSPLGDLLGKDGGPLNDLLGKDGGGLGGILDSLIPKPQNDPPGRGRSR